jgi:hypothetical protein
MTIEELQEQFKAADDEFLQWERIPITERRSNRRDLHAMHLLDELLPGTDPMVAAAEHDEIWLTIGGETLAAVVQPEQIVELMRCGIRYDEETDSLARFV